MSRETALTVSKEMINYKMMRVALDSVAKEYDLLMQNHIQEIKNHIKLQIADLVKRDVSQSLDFPSV
jgi:hypothetical protein